MRRDEFTIIILYSNWIRISRETTAADAFNLRVETGEEMVNIRMS